MRTLIPALVLVAALPAAAQTVAPRPSFGVKLGVNAATVSDVPDGFDTSSRLGLVAGLMADVPFTPSLSFRPEVLYTQKGIAVDIDEGGLSGTLTNEFDYLEVPLLLAYTFPSASALEVAVEAGPTLAYKLDTGIGCSGDFEGECDDDFDTDEDDGIEDFDLGAALGVTVGAGPFGVGVRYTAGLTSILDEDDGFVGADDESPKNRALTATVHYRFGR